MNSNPDKHRTVLMDRMVFIGFGLAVIYWILEALMSTLQNEGTSFIDHLAGCNLNETLTRLMVLCFFLIFGSHAQYTINQRKKLDDALIKSEEKYRTIIESIEDGYFETDLDGNLSFFNDSMCRITGYTKKELNDADFQLFTDHKNFLKICDTFKNILQTGADCRSDYRFDSAAIDLAFVKYNKTKCYVEGSVSLKKDSSSQTKGFRGLIRDVTTRREAEALKHAKAAAEAASKAKSEFLANMSHEIRTPLNSIIGLIELMRDSKLDAEQKEDLDIVLSAAYSLLSVINDILDFSKIEAGRLELEELPINLRDMIGDSLKIIAKNAHKKGLELAYRVAPDVPDCIVGDPARLRQILLNLAGNAVKFTKKGEVIVSVEAANRTDTEAYLTFSVIDTGAGIAKDKQESIFNPFEQACNGTSRQFGGTGLGLAVSTQLVELMGGEIRLKSKLDKGSNFYFTVPFGIQKSERNSSDIKYPDLRNISVLVVDDNTSNLNIIKEMLESWEIYAAGSSSSEKAKTILTDAWRNGKPFNLVIIDFEQADLDKFSLPEWINQNDMVNPDIITMLTSSYRQNNNNVIDSYVKTSLRKPVRPSDLLNALMFALNVKQIGYETEQQNKKHPTLRISPEPLNFLVAEDTLFNQKFISRLLDRWGVKADIVENGYEVLEALKKKSYDILLMDVQMPKMDGLDATRAVRKNETTTGGHIPIIAMTAHAMKGDRELCLEAGMDDYVSKPISSEILYKSIKSLLSEIVDKKDLSDKPTDSHAIFDKEKFLKMFDNDWDFFKESADMFLEDYPDMIKVVKEAVKEGNADGLRRTAHALKGMLCNFQAESAAEMAYTLEKTGLKGDLGEAENRCLQLEDEVIGFAKKLSAFAKDTTV